MHPQHFLDQLDEKTITNTICSIEDTTMGQMRIFVSRRRLRKDNLMHRAVARFRKLGLNDRAGQQGILLYFLPRDQRFVILASPHIHQMCGDSCWKEIASKVQEFLQQQQFNQAVLHALEEVGRLLAGHFPRR